MKKATKIHIKMAIYYLALFKNNPYQIQKEQAVMALRARLQGTDPLPAHRACVGRQEQSVKI